LPPAPAGLPAFAEATAEPETRGGGGPRFGHGATWKASGCGSPRTFEQSSGLQARQSEKFLGQIAVCFSLARVQNIRHRKLPLRRAWPVTRVG
jgi:hypothetical protein